MKTNHHPNHALDTFNDLINSDPQISRETCYICLSDLSENPHDMDCPAIDELSKGYYESLKESANNY